MPLTQEKPRFETLTNNNDHNYLHKKFKKMASTIPRVDDQSSESDSSLNKDAHKPHTLIHTNITNHSIAAAHPEIEKIKIMGVSPEESNGFLKSHVQANKDERINVHTIANQHIGESSTDEGMLKTENIETDYPMTSGRYVCPYCAMSCAKPSVLRKHIRAHTNERPYPCSTCGIAFKTKSNFYKHCRSRSHVLRYQGGENDPPINEDDWSPESESDTSLPPPSGSELCYAVLNKQPADVKSRASEISSPELSSERVSPNVLSNPQNTEANQLKAIYKPKFHSRTSLFNDSEQNAKKGLSSNPNFLNEHISKIISENEAIVDILETPLQKKYGKIKYIGESRQSEIEGNFQNIIAKTEAVPLNLSKSKDDILRRKRSHSDSFLQPDHKHPLNPEGSIIKDLLLKAKNCTNGLLPVTSTFYDPVVDTIESYKTQYYEGDEPTEIFVPAGQKYNQSRGREHSFLRSNSVNVTLYESQNASRPRNIPNTKPENLVIIKPESSEIIAPLPSPGPLLGNTRLVDSRIDTTRMKTICAKRRLDSRNEGFNTRQVDDMSLLRVEPYPQIKKRCFESSKPPTTLRSLEELSHSPIRQNSTSLQMFGGEVKIFGTSGNTTTLRIEPTRQLSPILLPRSLSPNSHTTEGEASNIVRSGLHSGGTITHNPPTPKENTSSPHPQTPNIMSIASSVTAPNLTVASLGTPNITHFRFPPLGAITAYNPLTLPPLSPSLSPNGATTIVHGGKLIPHVPGIPGPNTPASFGAATSGALIVRFPQKNNEFLYPYNSHNEEVIVNRTSKQPQMQVNPNFENTINNLSSKVTSPGRPIKDCSSNISPEKNLLACMPHFKIRHVNKKSVAKTYQSNNDKYDDKTKDINMKLNISDQKKNNILNSPKMERSKILISPQKSENKIIQNHENRDFNFENLITKAEIYNSGQHGKLGMQKEAIIQEPITVLAQTQRSTTSYFQKSNTKTVKEETKARFLRPSSLPLKLGTFTPKTHRGITSNGNTMPLISPETPRNAKAFGQVYLNGNAYTYLGLKASTQVFFCTLDRPQPTYVPNQVFLSMYCNWKVLLEQAPNPLGLSTRSLIGLYDSRHRPQNVTVAVIKQDQILTHSSQWKKDVLTEKQKSLQIDQQKIEDLKSTSSEVSSQKNKDLAGGFESNEEYTYVRGRGRGRYVCLECGIRCKKPSMLKKHIRTHTDVRPYTCKHCCFSFKTKGNLTKHMKSKAHYKKCTELGINPNEGVDADNELNQGSGETDDDSDSDGDDGNEGETESSDTDSYKSRLPEHEAAHCLLSLSGSRPSSAPGPGLLTSARPSTYPYTPTGHEETPTSVRNDIAVSSEAPIENEEPVDLSKGDLKSPSFSEITVVKESSILASLASNTAKLPVQVQWNNGEPMLQVYLTEKALQGRKIKQSQFISSMSKNLKRHELPKIAEHESSNLGLNGYHTQNSIPNSVSMHNADGFSVALTYSRSSASDTFVSHSVNISRISYAEQTSTQNTVSSSTNTIVETNKTTHCNEVHTSTENAKFVASEYLKMARGGKADPCVNSEEIDKQEPSYNNSCEESTRDSRESNGPEMKTIKNVHSESFPMARKVVIGAGGIAFKVDSKNKDYQTPAAYTPGRLTEDGRSVCNVCNKSFSKPSQLRLHINIHYMERPYRCSACAVSFRTRGHLQKHERSGSHHNKVSMTSTFGAATSSNPRPFRCSDCNVAFRIHGHLAKHLRSKMHVMRLECLSKLPFGTFAEIERAGVSLTDIDTTDCANSLASLQLLAQKLHEKDPTKLESWDPTMVPPLLPAGRESSDDEDGPLQVDLQHNQHSDRENNEVRTNTHTEGLHPQNVRVMYSATDT